MDYIGYIVLLIVSIVVSADNRKLKKRIEKLEWKVGVGECCDVALTRTFKQLREDIQNLNDRIDQKGEATDE